VCVCAYEFDFVRVFVCVSACVCKAKVCVVFAWLDAENTCQQNAMGQEKWVDFDSIMVTRLNSVSLRQTPVFAPTSDYFSNISLVRFARSNPSFRSLSLAMLQRPIVKDGTHQNSLAFRSISLSQWDGFKSRHNATFFPAFLSCF
jgi:hypothetical protein